MTRPPPSASKPTAERRAAPHAPVFRITLAEVESELRAMTSRAYRGDGELRCWLLSVLGWMERNGVDVFTEEDAERARRTAARDAAGRAKTERKGR